MSNTYPPYYAYPSAPPLVRAMPKSPGLHWGWVLALNIVTIGFFGMAWMIVQAHWARKVRGSGKALWWAIAYPASFVAFIAGMFILGVVMAATGHAGDLPSVTQGVTVLAQIYFFVLYLVIIYSLRGELEKGPINIPLSGGMTFFFGTIYFQYHLHDYERSSEGGAAQPSATLGLGLNGASAIIAEPLAPAPPQA